MLRGVHKLEAGQAMEVRDGRILRRWFHYDLPYGAPIEPWTAAEAAGRVREAVATAVRRQMVADVPVGAFLSGGLDSSAVVAFARREPSAGRLACFTIGFRDDSLAAEGFVDDLPYARRVAQALDVDLHTIEVGPEIADGLPQMVWQLDEPQADPAPLHVRAIAGLAREHGIKVLLSGVGGDDLFTGYRRHWALQQEGLWAWLPRSGRRLLQAGAMRLPAGGPLGRRVRKSLRYAAWDGDARLASYFLWTEPQVLDALSGPALRAGASGIEPVTEPLRRTLARLPAGVDPLNRMLYLEGKHFLCDHNLNYADKMSMATGVEVRVPLLDTDLVSLAARIPPSLKQRGRVGKWVFKKAMEGVLPAEVIWRPKTGFGAPLRRWLRQELRPLVDDLLSERTVRERGLFDPGTIAALRADDAAGRVDGSYTLLSLLCVELWCRLFLSPAPAGVPAAAGPPSVSTL
jgi:asparagine synthase (glutamine-hydrolysing)